MAGEPKNVRLVERGGGFRRFKNRVGKSEKVGLDFDRRILLEAIGPDENIMVCMAKAGDIPANILRGCVHRALHVFQHMAVG